MKRDALHSYARTGDVLLVHGSDAEQKTIQAVTNAPFCHAALLVEEIDGLYVSEMVEGIGYQKLKLDDWFAGRPSDVIFVGTAPAPVEKLSDKIKERLQIYSDPKNRSYDYSQLAVVWLSDVTGIKFDTDGEVCSLLVQNAWAATGYETPGNASPGDFLFLCESVSRLV
jgi:hypothetical protein